MLQQLHQRIFHFSGSVLGFDSLDAFRLSVAESNPAFAYLECVDDESIGFIVTSPFGFFADYQFEIGEKDKEELGLAAPEEVLVLSIVNVKNPFTESTINLLAPLVVNVANNRGRQIILSTPLAYSSKEKLIKKAAREGGEDAC